MAAASGLRRAEVEAVKGRAGLPAQPQSPLPRTEEKAAAYQSAVLSFSMPTQKKNQQPENSQPGDPLFNLHHAEAEAELARQNPVAMTTSGLSANESITTDTDDISDTATGPLDSQGQRRGQSLNTPNLGTTAGHH
jgi:hypothetical protein